MKHILRLGLILALFTTPLLAAKNSQVFDLPSDVRAGNAQLPQGSCAVSWTGTPGSEVQLTIKTSDRKTTTIPARMVEGKQVSVGVVTFVVNGVTYLQEFQTKTARFIVQEPPKDLK